MSVFTLLSCSPQPIKPKSGMAVINSAYIENGFVGKILDVISEETGRSLKVNPDTKNWDVEPGQYVIKFTCNKANRRKVLNFSNKLGVQSIRLKSSDILYARPIGRIVIKTTPYTNQLIEDIRCETELYFDRTEQNKKNKKYL